MGVMGRRIFAGAILAATLAAGLGATPAGAATSVRIGVLSNRADLISGGDALVRVTPARAKVTLNGRSVTKAFAVRPDGRYLALLSGLRNGANTLSARSGKRAARLTLRNHAIG